MKPQQQNKKKLKEQKNQVKQEESFREVFGFFTNQVDVKKFLKQAKPIKGLQTVQEVEEKTQDEFLNPNEFAEIKGAYDDYNVGDIAIIFYNPDNEACIIEQRAVEFKEAEEAFEKILTVMTDEGVSKSQLKKERESFLLAFLTLNDFKDESDKGKEKQKKERNKRRKPANPKKTAEAYQQIDDKSAAPSSKKQATTYENYLKFEQQLKKFQNDQKLKNRDKFDDKDKRNQDQEEQPFAYDDEYDQGGNDGNSAQLDPIKELLKIDLADTAQFKKVKKTFMRGGYLEKKFYDNSQKNFDWICNNNQPKDFMTLVRFTAIAKLSRNGFIHCRQFISSTGDYIIVILKSSQTVITRQAQNMKTTKQLELGYADLFSLEPVDERFRPLRLKKYIRQYATNEAVKKRLAEITEGRKDEEPGKLKAEKVAIEDHCKVVYNKVTQWESVDLQAQVIKKQQEVDKALKIISKELNIDQSHEKVEIIDDQDISDEEWQAYYVYMEYLLLYAEQMQTLTTKMKCDEVLQNQAFLYKLIFRKAIGDSNEFWYERNFSLWREILQKKQILQNLWDRLNVDPVSPFTEFFQPNSQSGAAMWRKYEINELGQRSEFINMEKIKLTQTIILKNINILKMFQMQYAFKYFPLHDHYQLLGITKKPFFDDLDKGGFMNKYEESAGQIALKELYKSLQDEAEANDFDTDSLEKECEFNIREPWNIPISTLRGYYGEKIALYFTFLSYYTKQLWYMGILGIISQAMISVADSSGDKNTKRGAIIFFSLCIVVWCTFFIEFWKRQQVLFSVQYGQQNFEEDEAERPAFEGDYIRSITNDDLNEEFYSPFLRKMKMLISLSVSFIIIGCVIGCVIGIFTLRNSLVTSGADPLVISIVPSLLNSIQINFFNFVYNSLVLLFNDYENHKISSSYENSHIAKIFIFMFVNNFNSFFIISFLESYFSGLKLCQTQNKNTNQSPNTKTADPTLDDTGSTINDTVTNATRFLSQVYDDEFKKPITSLYTTTATVNDCFGVLQNQMTTIFIVNFVNNIPQVLTPLIIRAISQQTKDVDERPVKHAFNLIDSSVEEQLELKDYQINPEVDGTVDNYMKLVIQFCYLSLFGLAFPAAYPMAFVSNIAQIQVDKYMLIRICIRPFPQGASNIGNWLIIIEVITFLGIFCNAGLIVFTSQTVPADQQIILFSILLVVFLALKYLIRFLVPDEPESARILNKRHQYVVDRVVKGFSQSGQKTYTPARLNMKIGGVLYQSQLSNVLNQQDSSQREPSIQDEQ